MDLHVGGIFGILVLIADIWAIVQRRMLPPAKQPQSQPPPPRRR